MSAYWRCAILDGDDVVEKYIKLNTEDESDARREIEKVFGNNVASVYKATREEVAIVNKINNLAKRFEPIKTIDGDEFKMSQLKGKTPLL